MWNNDQICRKYSHNSQCVLLFVFCIGRLPLICQGYYFTGIGMPQCQWNNLEKYRQMGHMKSQVSDDITKITTHNDTMLFVESLRQWIHSIWCDWQCRNRCDVMTWTAFRITGPLWGESTGHRWIPLEHNRPVTRRFIVSLLLPKTSCWTNSRFQTPWRSFDVTAGNDRKRLTIIIYQPHLVDVVTRVPVRQRRWGARRNPITLLLKSILTHGIVTIQPLVPEIIEHVVLVVITGTNGLVAYHLVSQCN